MGDNKRFAQAASILQQLHNGTAADAISVSLNSNGLHFRFEKREDGQQYKMNIVVSYADIEYAEFDIAKDVIQKVVTAEVEDDG